jgi:hypothetical protein
MALAGLCGSRALTSLIRDKRGDMVSIECTYPSGHDGPHAFRDPKTGRVLVEWFREPTRRPEPETKPVLKIDKHTRNFKPRKKEETLW